MRGRSDCSKVSDASAAAANGEFMRPTENGLAASGRLGPSWPVGQSAERRAAQSGRCNCCWAAIVRANRRPADEDVRGWCCWATPPTAASNMGSAAAAASFLVARGHRRRSWCPRVGAAGDGGRANSQVRGHRRSARAAPATRRAAIVGRFAQVATNLDSSWARASRASVRVAEQLGRWPLRLPPATQAAGDRDNAHYSRCLQCQPGKFAFAIN